MAQKRIANLIKILKNKNGVFSNIRSLVKVVVDYPRDPSPSDAKSSFKDTEDNVKTRFGTSRPNTDSPERLEERPDWKNLRSPQSLPDNPRNPIYATLLEMCSMPKLKTLGFEYINNLPYSFVVGHYGPRAYTQLVLRSIIVVLDGPQAPSFSAVRAVGALEASKLLQMPPSYFLTPMNSLLPHFKNLVVNLPTAYAEREELWRFILWSEGQSSPSNSP
jgi:hypothetical protein